MQQYLLIAQIIVSILIIVFIALQQRGTALGSAFGGGGGEFYASRRGLQKKIFYATIVLSAIFILLGILNLLL